MKRFQFDSTALRYFLAVVDTGSVNGAAARLNVVSSAVSRQIAGLEQRLHNQLFERHPKGMRVTEAGRILADHARRVEADAARTYAEIDGQNGRYTQTVKVAGAPGFATYALPRKFAAFQAEHPSVRFNLHILTPARSPRASARHRPTLASPIATSRKRTLPSSTRIRRRSSP